jgi:hypothetical protein
MALQVEGFVEVTASLFEPGVLEAAFRNFLAGPEPPKVIYGRDPAAVLGRVTNIGGRGEKVLISAVLDSQPAGTMLKDCLNKIASGTVKALSIEGEFASDHAVVEAICIAPLSPLLGTGYLTSIGPTS